MSQRHNNFQSPNLSQAQLEFNRSNSSSAQPLPRVSTVWPHPVNTAGSRLWAFDTGPPITPIQGHRQQPRYPQVQNAYSLPVDPRLNPNLTRQGSGQYPRLPPGLHQPPRVQSTDQAPTSRANALASGSESVGFKGSPSKNAELQRLFREPARRRQLTHHPTQPAPAPQGITRGTAAVGPSTTQPRPANIPANILPAYPASMEERRIGFSQYGWYLFFGQPHLYVYSRNKELKVFACQQCNWYTTDAQNLRDHVRATHMVALEAANYSCENCGETFKYLPQWGMHVNVHDGDGLPKSARRPGVRSDGTREVGAGG